jgi:hypothetical protein
MMIPMVILFVFLVIADLFIGIPAIYFMLIMKADFVVVAAVGLVMLLAPMISLMVDMNRRSKFDVRCDVSYRIGELATSEKTMTVEDRIGYVDVLDEKGKKTGAKEWKLMNLGKPVQGFEPKYIEQRRVWWGYWTTKHAHVVAVQGEKGEEFHPLKYDPSIGDYTPAFSGDKGLLYYKLAKSIEAHNKLENLWKEYLPYIIIGGEILLMIIMVFLCFLTLKDITDKLGAVAANFGTCSQQTAQLMGVEMNKTAGGAKPGNIMGIPFGAS